MICIHFSNIIKLLLRNHISKIWVFPVLPRAVELLLLIEGNFINLLSSPRIDLSLFFMVWDTCMLSDCFFTIYSSILDNFINYFSRSLAIDMSEPYYNDLYCSDYFVFVFLYRLKFIFDISFIWLTWSLFSCFYFKSSSLILTTFYSFFWLSTFKVWYPSTFSV